MPGKPNGVIGGRLKTRRGQVILGTGLAILLLGYVLQGIDWGALGLSLRNANPWPLLAVVVVTVAAYWLRALRWGSLLRPLAPVGATDLFSATMLGFASSLIVPRSGELLRPWLISRRHAIPMSAGFATIVIERLIDLISVLGLFGLYLFILPRPEAQADGQWMKAVSFGGGVAALIAVGLLCLLLALHANAGRVLAQLERLLARAPRWLADRLGGVLHSFSGGLVVLRAPAPHLALIGLQSLAVWLLTALGYHLTQVAFGVDLPFHTTFLLIAFLVVGEAIPTPGLIGGFHAFYVLALAEVYGVDWTTAVAAGITAHALTNLPVIALGAVYLGREGLSVKRLQEAPKTETG
jgi:uncharacterized protein (TIRG00374 family)